MRIVLVNLIAVLLVTGGPVAGAGKEWPGERDVLFALGGGLTEILAFDPEGDELLFNYQLDRKGFARLDSRGNLLLANGTCVAKGQAGSVLRRLRDAKGFTMELVFTPAPDASPDEARAVVHLGPHISLLQQGKSLVLRARGADPSPRVECSSLLPPSDGPLHVAVSWFREGAILSVGDTLSSDVSFSGETFTGWKGGEIVFGSGSPEKEGFSGTVHAFALHRDPLTLGQVDRQRHAAKKALARRPAPDFLVLKARLLTKSKVSTPEEIAPYRESLAVFEYEVLGVEEGFYLPKKIRVAHWVVLDATSLPFGATEAGAEVRLRVESFQENRQLETVNLSDTLELDFDLDLYYDAGGASLGH